MRRNLWVLLVLGAVSWSLSDAQACGHGRHARGHVVASCGGYYGGPAYGGRYMGTPVWGGPVYHGGYSTPYPVGGADYHVVTDPATGRVLYAGYGSPSDEVLSRALNSGQTFGSGAMPAAQFGAPIGTPVRGQIGGNEEIAPAPPTNAPAPTAPPVRLRGAPLPYGNDLYQAKPGLRLNRAPAPYGN